MLIVGERINTSRGEIAPAVENRDEDCIIGEARMQIEAGADLLDVNAGTLVKGEEEALCWLVETIQAACDQIPLCIDTPNPRALEAALGVHRGRAMLNSISAERERMESMLPLAREHGCRVIGLCMDDDGMPETAEERCGIASGIIDELEGAGIERDRIYIDPLIRPISTGEENGRIALDTIRFVRERFEGVHTICGLSNISYGLPHRRLLNHGFLVSCMTAGMDSAILDPTDGKLVSLLKATEALLGRDPFGMQFITAQRKGELEI